MWLWFVTIYRFLLLVLVKNGFRSEGSRFLRSVKAQQDQRLLAYYFWTLNSAKD
jgi:hypothetical protein